MVQQANLSRNRDILTRIQDQDDLVDALRSDLDGRVLTPDDAEYDEARTPYFPVRIGKPVAVVRPKHADDVARVVEAARRTGLPLFVRSGAHHAAAHSTGDGLIIDLRSLNNLDIDVAGQTAWVGTGLTAREVAWALEPHGLAVGFGDTGSVGIGGLTLGGGIGFLSRLHGMTIDNVLAAEIVTADGRVHTIDHEHEPDLFWAIRGGGGNYGVVTKFRYRLASVPQVYGGPLILPATPATISRLAQACAEADDALTVIPTVMPAPPMPFLPAEIHGQMVIMAAVCYAGDLEQAEDALRPLREIATPVMDMVQPMPYAALLDEEAPVRGHPMAIRTMFGDHIDESVGAAILEGLNRSDSWLPLVHFRVLGGAISRVAPDATAYAHRKSPIMMFVARPLEDDELAARQWTEELATALYQGDDGAYINFFGPHDRDRIEAAYPGETLARLRRIKASYDPTNLFRNNENITPA
ncbi:MAG TPA: FAD-binding oxidoreductase [Propionibacteriaceae bacterium]|nr:FAD-binding oxidoreductase [Propionibacteriaceae bacterium]